MRKDRIMNKSTFRLLSLLLCLLLVLPMLFACGDEGEDWDNDDDEEEVRTKKDDDEDEDDSPSDTKQNSGWGNLFGTTAADTYDTPTTSTDVVSDSYDQGNDNDIDKKPTVSTYDGLEFWILSAGQVAYQDFGYNSDESEILARGQYDRQKKVEEQYEIVISFEIAEDKNSSKAGPGFQKFQKAALAMNLDYHLGIIGGYDVSNLAQQNYLYDLNSLEYIDTSNPWWDQNANDDLTINGMLFFTNGSLTAACSESTYVMYVNEEIASSCLGGVDLYQLVRDGKWTVDKLREYARMYTEDDNGDDIMNGEDKYGLYVWDDALVGMLEAAGTKVATVGDDNKISLTLYNDNSVAMFNKYMDIACDNKYALQYQRTELKPSEGVVEAFKSGKALFWQTSNVNRKHFRDMEVDCGILPYPKLSEDQARYYSTIAPYNSQFICVPIYIDGQEDCISQITEALAYQGKQITWPAYYDDTLRGAFARDEGTYDMLNIIYGSYSYDLGLYYKIGTYTSVLANLLRNRDTGFKAAYEQYLPIAESTLGVLNANFDMVVDQWQG